MKRKAISLLMVGLLSLSVFAGCNNGAGDEGDNDKIKITYINWNLGTEEEKGIERRMIEEYEKLNEDVDIVIADYIDVADYANSLNTAAAGGKLPDVMMLQSIPSAMTNEWLRDITEFTAEDEDWSKIAEPVVQSTMYGESVYAVPAGQFLAGYFVNKDLFEQANVKQPEMGYTMEELETALRAVHQPNNNIIALNNELNMIEWYAALEDGSMGWYTFDGEKFNLNAPGFKAGLDKAKSFAQNGLVYEALPQEQKDKFNGDNGEEVWLNGQVAAKYDGTWITTGLEDANFSYEYIGLPNNMNVIINDYMGISNTSEHPEEAYKFAKWMTFSKEGTLKRIELAEEEGLTWNSLPIINDEEVNEKFFSWNAMPGVLEAYENLDNSLVEGVKVIPGYAKARWEAPTGIAIGDKENATVGDLIFDILRGTTKAEDYINQINDLANQNYQEASEAIPSVTE